MIDIVKGYGIGFVIAVLGDVNPLILLGNTSSAHQLFSFFHSGNQITEQC